VNVAETAKIVAAIAQMIPQQKFDENTPEWWAVPLAEIQYGDARDAILALIQRQPYIGVHDICTEVAALRKARVKAFEDADGVVPNVDPDDPRAFADERRAIMRAVADRAFDIDAYRHGGITLTGATPHRSALESGVPEDPERLVRMMETGVQLPRVPVKDVVRARNAAEQAAFERVRAEQQAGLQVLIHAETEVESA
jgi:hypothetical protein